jgi:hypothetical protein
MKAPINARKKIIGSVKSVIRSEKSNSIEGNIRMLASTGKLARAGQKAVRAQKEMGLAVTFKRGRHVIKQFPDGSEKILEDLPKPDYKLPAGVKVLARK